jgi:cell division protein FtsW (lipid II flippase)
MLNLLYEFHFMFFASDHTQNQVLPESESDFIYKVEVEKTFYLFLIILLVLIIVL